MNAVVAFNVKQELKFVENMEMKEILVMLQENARTICNVKLELRFAGNMEN
jgi:hypothetical protein